ncbi:hypothetical protein BJY00DRAFT_318905 [Aspergillus carlsbadensis]|nr:hypothetical protein BJY00DRAFT_318905 [Aspergillus carlsbadensis]
MMRPQLFGPIWAMLVVLAALAAMGSAFPTPSALAGPESDYVIPSWEVAVYPGAAPIILNGTVEQVYAKLLEMNPNYDDDWKNADDIDVDIDIDFDTNTALDLELERCEFEYDIHSDVEVGVGVGGDVDVDAEIDFVSNAALDLDLERREVEHDIHCFRSVGVQKKYLRSGIKYLRKVKGRPHLPPKKCGRVSCSYDSAIEWCNDREHDGFFLPSFNNIADGAQTILDICGKRSKAVKGWLGHGEDKWRVNVFFLPRQYPGQHC